MGEKYLSNLSALLFDSDLIASRFILGISELFWAIMLFWPGDNFSRPPYICMSRVMSANGWGMVFLISSCIQINILLRDDLHSKFAQAFAAFNAVLWGFVVASMLVSVWPPASAIAGEIALAMNAFWIFVRPYILLHGYKSARICRKK